jgi:hypothetical protein
MQAFCHAWYVPAQAALLSDVRRRRRRAGILALGALAAPSLLLAVASPAGALEAIPSPTPATGTTYCTITDPRLAELSGLVVLGNKMLAVADGGDQLSVSVLDESCAVTDERTAPVDPYDPEDLGVSADGTIWVADIGDNDGDRPTVALHALRADGGASLYRLTYPDGPHDAEALLVAPDGTPHLVTKEVLGASRVFRPAADLVDGGTVALEQVATVNLTLTGTPGGPVGRAGQLLVTGGAVSGDGRLIALRTYTDAYLWPLSGSDVAAALAADPIRIPLPESPQGEAISFGTDSRGVVIASEGSPNAVVIVPTEEPLAPVAERLEAPADDPPGILDGDRSPITSGLIAAAVATVAVWLGGKLSRRRE